jgi:hypothetical protein
MYLTRCEEVLLYGMYRPFSLVNHQLLSAHELISLFVLQFAEVYGNLLKPIIEIGLVSIALRRRMGGRHLLGFLAFFLLSAKWVLWVTPPFEVLAAERSQLEGEFRSHHARLIGASEEIALSGGTTREKEIVEGSFRAVIRQAKRHSQLECLQNAFEYYIVRYGSAMTAYTMLIPAMYFGTHGLKDKSANGLIEHYITCTQLFVAFGNACKALMANYKRVYALEGLAARVTRLAATFAAYSPRPVSRALLFRSFFSSTPHLLFLPSFFSSSVVALSRETNQVQLNKRFVDSPNDLSLRKAQSNLLQQSLKKATMYPSKMLISFHLLANFSFATLASRSTRGAMS